MWPDQYSLNEPGHAVKKKKVCLRLKSCSFMVRLRHGSLLTTLVISVRFAVPVIIRLFFPVQIKVIVLYVYIFFTQNEFIVISVFIATMFPAWGKVSEVTFQNNGFTASAPCFYLFMASVMCFPCPRPLLPYWECRVRLGLLLRDVSQGLFYTARGALSHVFMFCCNTSYSHIANTYHHITISQQMTVSSELMDISVFTSHFP